MLTHKNITLFGNVQGVFLRRTVEREANHRGVFGFIRNEPDGTVYIEGEAEEEILNQFIAWLKEGGGEGDYKIKEVDTMAGSFKGYANFEIRE